MMIRVRGVVEVWIAVLYSTDVLDGGLNMLNMLIASVRSKPARGKRSPNAKNSKAH